MVNIGLKTTTYGGKVSFLDSSQARYVRGGITLDAAQVVADVGTGLKKLPAGTFVGVSGGKYRKYVAAVKAHRRTGVVGNNNAIVWTAVASGVAGNALKTSLISPVPLASQAAKVEVIGKEVRVTLGTTAGTKALLATGVEGNNNGLTWTAVTPGVAAHGIKVALIDPAANSQALKVTIVNDTIHCSLATGGAGAITTTGAELLAAVNAHLIAKGLVVVSHTGASTGAAAVVAAGAAPLAGGADPVISSTAAEVIALVNGDVIASQYVTCANDGASTGAAAVVADAATVLADGADANVVPTLMLADDVIFSTVDPVAGVTHADQAVTAIDHARVITARLPVAPDAYVKANMPGITWV